MSNFCRQGVYGRGCFTAAFISVAALFLRVILIFFLFLTDVSDFRDKDYLLLFVFINEFTKIFIILVVIVFVGIITIVKIKKDKFFCRVDNVTVRFVLVKIVRLDIVGIIIAGIIGIGVGVIIIVEGCKAEGINIDGIL